MRPTVLVRHGKFYCPFCHYENLRLYKLRKPRPRWIIKRYSSKNALMRHFDEKHSWDAMYIFRIAKNPNRIGNFPFTVDGVCGCGCMKTMSYPSAEENYMPSRFPPFFKSGHLSKIESNSGQFQKGCIAWNKGTKGVMKPNSGTFKKGHLPPNYKGGITNVDGYLYQLTDELHPCGVKKRVNVAREEASKTLGRPLETNEVVIHKNGERANNSWDNLEVITRAENVTRNRWKNRKKSKPVEQMTVVEEFDFLRDLYLKEHGMKDTLFGGMNND